MATWPSLISELLTSYAPGGLYGRTCPASCHLTKDGILGPSSGRWANSGMGGLTESWTLSTSEFHSAAAASSLSDILEVGDVPQRFYLSPKACSGILRRAEKRGKELPEALAAALREVAALEQTLSAEEE